MEQQWQEYSCNFNTERQGKKSIKIFHDLPNTDGLNIDGAFHNWIHRTKEYTSQSFANYIMSKNHMTGNFAYTEKEWKALEKND